MVALINLSCSRAVPDRWFNYSLKQGLHTWIYVGYFHCASNYQFWLINADEQKNELENETTSCLQPQCACPPTIDLIARFNRYRTQPGFDRQFCKKMKLTFRKSKQLSGENIFFWFDIVFQHNRFEISKLNFFIKN